MAKVKFTFDGGSTMTVGAASDRSAKLIVSGLRRRMEDGGDIVEVKSEDGSSYVNPARLAFIELLLEEGGAKKRKPAARKAAPAKKKAPAKRRR